MSSNIHEFNAGLDAFADEIPEDVAKIHRAVALEALRGVVLMTPVDTGRARGNWQVTQDSPAVGDIEVEDKSGGATIAKGAAAVAEVQPYTETWITNNVEYIEALEDGHSKQAPVGMLNVTFERLRGWLARMR